MRRDDQSSKSPNDAAEGASYSGLEFEISEGTDPATLPASARGDATQVAEIPQRPTAPGTEFIHFYAPGSSDFEGVEAWPEPRPVLDSGLRSATGSGTIRTPRERLLRKLGFTGVILVLVGVITGSVYTVYTMPDVQPETRLHASQDDEDGSRGQDPSEQVPQAPREPVLIQQPPARGLDADALLRVSVQEVTAERKLVEQTFGGRIEAGRVTVVNLWATWCKPCRRELRGFKEMFETAGWAEQVRFVPMQVSDPRDALWAKEQYSDLMPRDTEHFLSDPRSRGGVLDALRDMSAPEKRAKTDGIKFPKKPDDINLPVTLVFDCRRDVRLFHVGELLASDFVALQALLDTLQGELGTDFCAVRKPRPQPKPADVVKLLAKPVCGNGKCERPEEDENNCCDCWICEDPRDKCVRPPGGKPRCILRGI